MSLPQLDPRFEEYVRENPTISYAQPDDPWLVKHFISSMEVVFGRRKIESVYRKLKEGPFAIEAFFQAAFAATGIQPCYDDAKLAAIPKTGPLVFVANHPFGVIDGMALCDMAIKARGEFRILINAMLCQDRDLAPYFLPIDFKPTKAALKNNINAKKVAQECLAKDIPIIIFPSGFVSTANKRGFGEVIDAPWTTFAAKLIRDAQATVVPVYFHGRNSRRFHLASHIAEPLRMALLLNEALQQFGKEIKADIGAPLPWSELSQFTSRQTLTDFLYQQVQKMAPKTPPPAKKKHFLRSVR